MSLAARLFALALGGSVLLTAAPASAFPMEAPKLAGRIERRAANEEALADIGSKIVERALGEVGTPYVYGGMTPGGFDCSGFTRWVYEGFGITLPHSSSAQYSLGGSEGYVTIADPSDLKPGDLVFQATGGYGVGHAGIYVGDGHFVSATSSEGVQVKSLYDSYWGPLWVGGVRVVKVVAQSRGR